MTQAPTPGPLDWTAHDGSDVPIFNTYVDVVKRDGSEWANIHSGQWGQDWLWSDDDTTKADIVSWRPASLAPTAPVEASRSERERIAKCIIGPRRAVPTDSKFSLSELRDVKWESALPEERADALNAADAILNLRPQPSGEAREAVARIQEEIDLGGPHARIAAVQVRDLRTILALLSARPLAVGGQQGFGGEVRSALQSLLHYCKNGSSNTRLLKAAMDRAETALSTTPARAEAQDEGAATDALVDRFAVALKAKLRAAGEKYGFDDAWRADDWRDKLIEDLWRHVQKGDPRDVAAYCAFAWHHQWSLSNGVFPRAGKNLITPQDEGAAGEPVAKVVRKGFSTGSISWTKFGQDADLSDETPLYAHPSPTPAADAHRVRADRYYEALVQADLKIRSLPGTDQSDVEFIRAALKSEGRS